MTSMLWYTTIGKLYIKRDVQMKFLDNILEKFGSQNVIIACVSVLIVIICIIVYRVVKLKMYRKEIVELENQMNAIKTLPINTV